MYDLYEYSDLKTGVGLSFRFKRNDPMSIEQKRAFIELLFRGIADLKSELGMTGNDQTG